MKHLLSNQNVSPRRVQAETRRKFWEQRPRPSRFSFKKLRNLFRSRPSVLIHDPDLSLRLRLLFLALLCFAGLIGTRLYDLQKGEHSKWLEMASKQHRGSLQVQGVRGTLYDSAGRILATSVRAVSIGANPREISDISEAARQLETILQIPAKTIEERLRVDKNFVWLARGLPLAVKEQLEPLQITGLREVLEFRRYYPQGRLAGAVLGRVDRDGQGLSGVELSLESELRAPNVRVPVKRDARGSVITAAAVRESSDSFSALWKGIRSRKDGIVPAILGEPTPELADLEIRKEGQSAVLSIDSVTQDILDEEVSLGAKEAQAKRVYSLVMDAMSGEILALSQTPMFDPNQFENVSTEDLRNLVIQDNFEPGSTMKPLVAAVALDRGLVRENEILDCENGQYRVGPHTIRDVHPEGKLSLRDVLVRSSNICTAKLGQRLGAEQLHESLKAFGFGSRGEIQLPGEAAGILRPVSSWATVDVATHSFGQGVSVTALQLVRAYAVLANGGLLVQPTILKDNKERAVTRVISSKSAQAISAMLSGVTEDAHGTGKRAKISGVTVYGKTGTAQKARKGGRGYDPDRVLSSFIGYIDGREINLNRSLVMLVVVDEPGVKPRWGGALAAPVFQRAMSRILSHLLAVESKNTRAVFHDAGPKYL